MIKVKPREYNRVCQEKLENIQNQFTNKKVQNLPSWNDIVDFSLKRGAEKVWVDNIHVTHAFQEESFVSGSANLFLTLNLTNSNENYDIEAFINWYGVFDVKGNLEIEDFFIYESSFDN